jgi:hypothetical protein
MLYGLVGQLDIPTGDTSNYIVENAAAEIAATSPAPVAQPTVAPSAPAFSGWPVLVVVAAIGAWYWYQQSKRSVKYGHSS